MPKFYHGERLGFAYKARVVGWRRMFPFSLLPYLTGDEIKVRLSVKPLYEKEKWQQGTLAVEPPDYSKDEPRIIVSNSVFIFGDWPRGKWWSKTLSLKGGVRFRQPSNFQCALTFQNFYEDRIESTAAIFIADIEVVSRGPFLTWAFLWGFTTIVAIAGVILGILH